MNMYKLISALLVFVSIQAGAQNLLQPEPCEPTGFIKDILIDSILECGKIDFDGDGIQDYVVKTLDKVYTTTVYWITSESRVVKKDNLQDEFLYYWFVQIDDDQELETFNARGFPEGIDYFFSNMDYSSREETILCYINPVILDSTTSKHIYWGYPWDIEDVYQDEKRILISLEHEIDREGAEITYPDWQRKFPAVFFSGKSTQPNVEVEAFKDPTYEYLDEVIEKIKL